MSSLPSQSPPLTTDPAAHPTSAVHVSASVHIRQSPVHSKKNNKHHNRYQDSRYLIKHTLENSYGNTVEVYNMLQDSPAHVTVVSTVSR